MSEPAELAWLGSAEFGRRLLMPQDKDLKRLVRARMTTTGERYTQARAAIDTRGPDHSSDDLSRWLQALGEADRYHDAYQHLKALPADLLVPLAATGTGHANWRIRRGCCRLLDDLAFTKESFAALETCLADPDPRVRRASVHSLACQHCKPAGCVLDVRGVFQRALQDPSRKVRQMAVGPLLYGSEEDWRLDLLRQVVATDPSATLRGWARRRLESIADRDHSDEERRQLPAELVGKTERHAGKWVAISDGSIIDAGGNPQVMQRTARKHGHDDVCTYWVAP